MAKLSVTGHEAAVHLLMLMTAALVATSFTVGKAIAQAMDPAVLTLLRFGLATLFFLPYIRYKFGPGLPGPRDLFRYSVISLTLAGFFILMFFSLRFTTALNTGVLFTLVPGISSLYAMVLLKERLGRTRLVALFLAIPGAIWVLFHGEWARMLALELGKGDLIFLGACLLIGFYNPLVRLLYRGEPMAVMTFWVLATGCGWLFCAALPGLLATDWRAVSATTWLWILYLAVFCTIVSFFLSQWATLRLGPTRVMAYSYLYPPLILLIDWATGHGLPPLRVLPGVLLIGLTMLVVQREGKKGAAIPT